MENGKRLAFPARIHNEKRKWIAESHGLTKREYFAAMAMQGLLSADAKYNGRTDDRKALAKDAIANADELLKQLGNE